MVEMPGLEKVLVLKVAITDEVFAGTEDGLPAIIINGYVEDKEIQLHLLLSEDGEYSKEILEKLEAAINQLKAGDQ